MNDFDWVVLRINCIRFKAKFEKIEIFLFEKVCRRNKNTIILIKTEKTYSEIKIPWKTDGNLNAQEWYTIHLKQHGQKINFFHHWKRQYIHDPLKGMELGGG